MKTATVKSQTEVEILMGIHLGELVGTIKKDFERHRLGGTIHLFPSSLDGVAMLSSDRPAAVAEFKFHPERKWAFDFAIPEAMLAIEIEGGLNVYGRRGADGERLAGRHTRGRGYQEDLDKYNAAAALGWTVFRFSIQDVMCGKDVEVLKTWLAKKRG